MLAYEQQVNYNGLDLGKFLMAILVVAIHTGPLINCKNEMVLRIYSNINSLAVPFFFITTSWLFFVKRTDIYSDECMKALRKRIYHFIRIYVIWELIYFPCVLFGGYFQNGHATVYNVADYFRKFIFVGSNYYSNQFWFLLSMIYMLIICYIFLKWKLPIKKIWILSIFLYVIGFTINYFISIKPDSEIGGWLFIRYFTSLCNESTVFPYFIYIVIGMIMAKQGIEFSKKRIVFCILIGVLFDILLPNSFFAPALRRLFETVAVFQIFMQMKLNDRSIYIKFREASMVLYYTHFFFIFLYELTLNQLSSYCKGFRIFGVCLLCCIVLSMILDYLKKYPQFRWINVVFGG